MLKRNKFLQQFLKKGENIDSAKPSMPSVPASPSSKWYRTIAECPLNKFIEVLIDKNFSALIVSGFPSQLELEISWKDILGEYADKIGDHEHKLHLNLYKEIAILRITLDQITMLVECLEKVYYQPFEEKLNKLLLTNYKLNPDKPEEYLKTLKGCLNRSKAFKIDLDLKLAHFAAIDKKQDAGKDGYTREYFQSILITISDHAKYPITDSVTVFEFCERLHRWNSYCEMMQRQANGK